MQNGYPKEMWPLSLRTAVTGTKLEEMVEIETAYEDIKREILHDYGQSAEEVWKEVLSNRVMSLFGSFASELRDC